LTGQTAIWAIAVCLPISLWIAHWRIMAKSRLFPEQAAPEQFFFLHAIWVASIARTIRFHTALRDVI
jgi:hypothetical protein